MCNDSKRQKRLEAAAKWRAANKDYAKRKNAEFYAANSEREKERTRIYREANPDKVLEWRDARKVSGRNKANKLTYRGKHPERVRAARRASYAKRREVELECMRAWRKANPEKVNANGIERVARQLMATPQWADKSAILEIYKAAHAASEIFETPIHVDHIVPLRSKLVCGLHCESNLRLLPKSVNQSKSNRYWPDMPGAFI